MQSEKTLTLLASTCKGLRFYANTSINQDPQLCRYASAAALQFASKQPIGVFRGKVAAMLQLRPYIQISLRSLSLRQQQIVLEELAKRLDPAIMASHALYLDQSPVKEVSIQFDEQATCLAALPVPLSLLDSIMVNARQTGTSLNFRSYHPQIFYDIAERQDLSEVAQSVFFEMALRQNEPVDSQICERFLELGRTVSPTILDVIANQTARLMQKNVYRILFHPDAAGATLERLSQRTPDQFHAGHWDPERNIHLAENKNTPSAVLESFLNDGEAQEGYSAALNSSLGPDMIDHHVRKVVAALQGVDGIELAGDPSRRLRCFMRNKAISPDTIDYILENCADPRLPSQTSLASLASQNPRTSADRLDKLARIDDLDVKLDVAVHPSTSGATLAWIASNRPGLLATVLLHPNNDPAWLYSLAELNDPEVLVYLARSPNTPVSLLELIYTSTNDHKILSELAANPSSSSRIRASLSGFPDFDEYLADNPNTSSAIRHKIVLRSATTAYGWLVQSRASLHPAASSHTLDWLALNCETYVAEEVARHPEATALTLDFVFKSILNCGEWRGMQRFDSILKNPKAGSHTLHQIYLHRYTDMNTDETDILLAQHPGTGSLTLGELAASENMLVRAAVIQHRNTPDELRDTL